jgi:hypothetical protein
MGLENHKIAFKTELQGKYWNIARVKFLKFQAKNLNLIACKKKSNTEVSIQANN